MQNIAQKDQIIGPTRIDTPQFFMKGLSTLFFHLQFYKQKKCDSRFKAIFIYDKL